ncbi:hypothetical protein AOC36_05050 [Erysipelothrix larvae]|uniref:DNA repair protein RecO n=1 Tax=Erysipelothrix larvae TaxID=1514105 RepID=A0A0X8GZQ8_9FIRM|nr:DNA repair protein RecO [Erysipelothrix larvae]AMC93365.1 hypothetical protein AOC36_05050 [Erysipelothrix larvae]
MNDLDIGFVLSVSAYREHDAMILFLGEEKGMLRFVLPGYYKENSKQGALGLEYSKVRYRFRYRKDALLRIQTGELIDSYYQHRFDFDWLVYASLLSELCIRFYDEDHNHIWFNWFDVYLRDPSKPYLVTILVTIIKQMGYEPYVDGCVITHQAHVSDFSIEKGGFVSIEYRSLTSKIDLETLKLIRYIFKAETIDMNTLKESSKLDNLIEILIEYLQYHADMKFNSWKLISSV